MAFETKIERLLTRYENLPSTRKLLQTPQVSAKVVDLDIKAPWGVHD